MRSARVKSPCWKTARLISGCVVRVAERVKVSTASTANNSGNQTNTKLKPCVLRLLTLKISRMSAATTSPNWHKGNGRDRGACVWRIVLAVISQAIRPNGRVMPKIKRQDNSCVTKPPYVGPSEGANAINIPAVPVKRPWAVKGTWVMICANTNGNANPVPMAWMIRPNSSNQSCGATVHNKPPRTKPAPPTLIIVRQRKRCWINAVITMVAATASK